MSQMSKLILLLFLVLAPITSYSAPPVSESIDIGVLLCLSGNCSDWGTAATRGVELATRELNANSGILGKPVRLHLEDTRESISGAQAVVAYKKLTAIDGLKFLIGPSWSPGALAIAPLASSAKDLVVISPSASAEEFSRAGPNIFNMRPIERFVTEGLALHLRDKGFKRAAILTSSQPAESSQGQFFRDAFQASGGEIAKYIETNPELPDVRTEVTQIVATKPDVVFLMAYNQMLSAASSLHSLGYRGQIALISVDDERVAIAKRALEGAIVARAAPPSTEFVNSFVAAYGEQPGLSAENGYDAVKALALAITAAGSTDAKLIQARLKDVHFNGAAGEIVFNENRGVQQKPKLYKVVNGKLEISI